MFVAMVVASLMLLVVCVLSMRLFLRVTDIPKQFIVPTVMICCVIGAFALNNRVTDLYLRGAVGLVGYGPKSLDYPLAPLVLGVILGPIAETNLRRALMSDGDWTVFFTRPISAVLLAAALLSVIFSVCSVLKMRKKNRPATDEQDGD